MVVHSEPEAECNEEQFVDFLVDTPLEVFFHSASSFELLKSFTLQPLGVIAFMAHFYVRSV